MPLEVGRKRSFFVERLKNYQKTTDLRKIKGATLPEMLVSMMVSGMIMLSVLIFMTGFDKTRKRMSDVNQMKMNELRLFDELSRNLKKRDPSSLTDKEIRFNDQERACNFQIADEFVFKVSGYNKDSMAIQVERFSKIENDSLLILKAELSGGRTIDITKINSGLKHKSLDVF